MWPWSRINELTMEVLRQFGIACKVREERDWFQMVAKTWEANSDADNRSRRGWKWLYEQKCEQWSRAAVAREENYRAYKEAGLRFADLMDRRADEWEGLATKWADALTEERGLRDGWEQTAGELEVELARWKDMFHRTSQGRDANYRSFQQELRTNRAMQARLDDALTSWTEERGLRDGWEQTARENEEEIVALMGQVAQSDSLHQQVKIKDATIERLEAEVKRLHGGG